MRRERWRWRALALALVLLTGSSARAAERVLVVSPSPSRWSARLTAELRARGFEVAAPPVDEGAAATELDALATAHDAMAAIRLDATPGGVDIWVADRATGKLVARRVELPDSPMADDLAITKAVELLRASLLELRLTPAPGPVPREVGTLVGADAPAPHPGDESVLRIAPTLAFGSRAIPPLAQLGVEWATPWSRDLAVTVGVALPTVPASAELPRLTIQHGRGSLEGGLEWTPLRIEGFSARLGTTLGLEVSHTVGGPVEGRAVTSSDTATAALLLGSAGTTLSLGRGVGLDAEAACGASLPATEYLVDGATVARVGLPSCRVALGLSVGLGGATGRRNGEP